MSTANKNREIALSSARLNTCSYLTYLLREMSHLPGLSDFLGLKKKQPATVSSESNGSRVGLRDKTESKGDLAHISDEDQIKNLFSGMSRSLIKSTARVARNKKVG